jgi:hypothetical protein
MKQVLNILLGAGKTVQKKGDKPQLVTVVLERYKKQQREKH